MKTTLNLNEDLIASAKSMAAQHHSTLTRLIEEGLRLRLAKRSTLRALTFEFSGRRSTPCSRRHWHLRHDGAMFMFSAPARTLCALIFFLMGLSVAAAASPAPFEDSIAQRTLACTACHGPQGRAAPDGYYPRLAGKPAGYLYNQLLNFRDGRRHYALMTQLVDPLTDAYLLEIAHYFSKLDVPYPAPLVATAAADVLERGEQLVKHGDAGRQLPACVQCHGAAMTGVVPNVPGLLGLPRDYLNSQLGAWKAGLRKAHAPDCMKAVVASLSLDDINAVGSWLAAQPLPANTKPAAFIAASSITCGSAPKPVTRAEK